MAFCWSRSGKLPLSSLDYLGSKLGLVKITFISFHGFRTTRALCSIIYIFSLITTFSQESKFLRQIWYVRIKRIIDVDNILGAYDT